MYQNLRPLIDVRWPDAPRAKSYLLKLRRPGGKALVRRNRRPRFLVRPGMLRDGAHTLQVETSGKVRKRSKKTTVEVVFDNAAPTASLKAPPAAGFAPGGRVRIAGVAVSGSRVSVGGRPIELDGHHRFDTEVPVRAGQRGLAVRFQHARHGIRYYLRRARPR
jgi:hypothetical protein